MFDLKSIIRSNIKELIPYSSARDEFKGAANIFLDANENSLGSVLNNYNRYPDPLQKELKQAIGELKKINSNHIFLGNGSDECIDILYRCFCEPNKDNVIICPPTYGMYEVSANINAIEIRKTPLTKEFQLDTTSILEVIDENTRIVWICSPNNPTGNSMDQHSIKEILRRFNGIVVVDEAYIDFSENPSFLEELEYYPNLVILQTFSKAWGLAGLRLGMAFASFDIISVLNKVKPPYNINEATQGLLRKALQHSNEVKKRINTIIAERAELIRALQDLDCVLKVYPSQANFLLLKTSDATDLYQYLLKNGIVTRDRSSGVNSEGCLRITLGTPEENKTLLSIIQQYSN